MVGQSHPNGQSLIFSPPGQSHSNGGPESPQWPKFDFLTAGQSHSNGGPESPQWPKFDFLTSWAESLQWWARVTPMAESHPNGRSLIFSPAGQSHSNGGPESPQRSPAESLQWWSHSNAMVGQSTPNCQNGCQLYNWTPSPHFPLIRTSEILSIHTLFPMAKVPMLMPFLEDQLPATSCHSILVFVVPVILSFLALKYLGQNTSPFKTHPKTMGFSIGCLLVYCLAYGAQQKFSSALHQPPTYANAWGRCMEWFGSMLLASLASICFPDSVQWMFFVFYAILCMGGPSSLYSKCCGSGSIPLQLLRPVTFTLELFSPGRASRLKPLVATEELLFQ
ncbi:hypothetical protein CK203_073056 [Vitis vinifera]|uniref:Uncharacterized protein n=1 Tax=Vitis vinifera TaxID=29760 RepID=A0A438BZ39_VITVI|nr:hypothetical protein CK203_073056 [Vitis vinifera]